MQWIRGSLVNRTTINKPTWARSAGVGKRPRPPQQDGRDAFPGSQIQNTASMRKNTKGGENSSPSQNKRTVFMTACFRQRIKKARHLDSGFGRNECASFERASVRRSLSAGHPRTFSNGCGPCANFLRIPYTTKRSKPATSFEEKKRNIRPLLPMPLSHWIKEGWTRAAEGDSKQQRFPSIPNPGMALWTARSFCSSTTS